MKKIFALFSTCASLSASQALIVDPDLSPYMGAYDLQAAHRTLEYGIDYFCTSDRDTTLNVWGRALEQLLFWDTINGYTTVIQHEVFGHGYRLRELGIGDISYEIHPYSGSTEFKLDPEDIALGKINAISVAGLEAQSILAQMIKLNWVACGCLDGRLALCYTMSQQSIFWYTLITKLGNSSPGNDVHAYKEFLDASYPHDQISTGSLTTWASFSWLDPMTYYAYFAWFYYIALGCDWEFPMIPLTEGVYFLPNVRIGYAPYAPEAYLEGFFSIEGSPLYVYVKGGKRSVGAGFLYDDLFCFENGALGLHFDTWYQNKFITDATYDDFLEHRPVNSPELKDKIFGVSATVTGRYRLKDDMFLYGEIGGKTKGYLPGYSLDASVVGRFGLWLGGCP